jgi:hypothetical protein
MHFRLRAILAWADSIRLYSTHLPPAYNMSPPRYRCNHSAGSPDHRISGILDSLTSAQDLKTLGDTGRRTSL